jgi:hypothetical protein
MRLRAGGDDLRRGSADALRSWCQEWARRRVARSDLVKARREIEPDDAEDRLLARAQGTWLGRRRVVG